MRSMGTLVSLKVQATRKTKRVVIMRPMVPMQEGTSQRVAGKISGGRTQTESRCITNYR